MNREQKAVAIEEIAAHIDESHAIFAVDYRGISVPQVAELRAKLRDADATFKVVKNSLTERAADQAGAETLKEYLAGPTALTFVRGDAATAAKAIADYARATQLLPFKGGLMDGATLDVEQTPLALAPALARRPLRPARRRRRLARHRPRAQLAALSAASPRARPGAREEGVRRDPRRRAARGRRQPPRPRRPPRGGAARRGSSSEDAGSRRRRRAERAEAPSRRPSPRPRRPRSPRPRPPSRSPRPRPPAEAAERRES